MTAEARRPEARELRLYLTAGLAVTYLALWATLGFDAPGWEPAPDPASAADPAAPPHTGAAPTATGRLAASHPAGATRPAAARPSDRPPVPRPVPNPGRRVRTRSS